MDSITVEESTSLTSPSTKPSPYEQFNPHQHHKHSGGQQRHSTSSSMLHGYNNREKRIRLIRLGPIYYLAWILLILISALIVPYIYTFMPEPDCWQARQIQINLSITLALITSIISFLLFLIQLITRLKTNLCRRNFCRFSFFVFILIFLLNFLISIYFFNMFSCYFDQSTPDEQISDDNDWLTNLTIRYDLKIVAILHLISSLLAFFTGIGFAIIKNNFKYLLRIVDVN